MINKYFNELTTSLPEAYFLVSPAGDITAVNPAAEVMLGTDRNVLEHKKIGELVADPIDKVSHFLKICLRNREPIPGSLRWRTSNGQIIECRCNGSLILPERAGDNRLMLLRCEIKKSARDKFLALNRTLEQLKTSYRQMITKAEALSEEVIERQRAEEKIRESHARLLTILDGLDAVVYVADMKTYEIIFVNKFVKDLFGDVTGGMCWERLQSGQSGPCSFCSNKYLLDAGGNPSGVYHWECQNTFDRRWYDIHDRAVRWVDGRLVRMEIAEDITERKQAQEMIRESEEKFRSIFENAIDGIMIADPMTKSIIEANSTMGRMLGYAHDEIVGLHVQDFHPKEELTFVLDAFGKQLRGEMPLALDMPMQRKDGSVFYCDVNAAKITIREQQYLIGIFRDITNRKEMEKHLKMSEVLNRSILDSIGEALVVIDRDYRIISANRAYYKQSHATALNLTGQHCYHFSHQINRPCYEVGEECAPKHTFETGEAHSVMHVHHDQAGNPAYVEIHSYPLKDESGAVTSVIEVMEDVTEQKKLEGQLLQSQKMEAVGQLAGGVAHDFNNILTAIIGHAAILQMKMKQDDPLRSSLEQILASANRATNLTQSLLAFSRKQVLNPKSMDLNETIRQVERFLHRLIGEDITFDIKPAPESLIVMADHGQIEQVLMNLATNARDAMPGGGLLRIETSRVVLSDAGMTGDENEKPGSYALTTVSDTGTGMDEHTRRKIFEPFFTTKEVGRGTGLGLAIVYGIIKQHRGFINVDSDPGKGTIFKIYLPLIAARMEKETSGEITVPARGTETVLLAEDDDVARNLSKQVLEDFGYKAIVARDGAEAVDRFIEHRDRIKLVILDVIMPKKNAREVYDEIQKRAPGTKILFTSGYTADVIHKQGILDEGLNFLFKPVSPTVFLKKVRDLLDSN